MKSHSALFQATQPVGLREGRVGFRSMNADMTSNSPINVLLVEDNPVDVLLAKKGLEDSPQLDVTVAERLGTALELLKKRRFDVVLLDLGLPDCQGLDTFSKLHQNNSSIPFIVMTAKNDSELALRAVREGAQDYLAKNQVQGELLSRSIRYAIERQRSEATINRIVREVTEQKRMEAKLREAERKKDEFLAMLSHELRNPLASLTMAVRLLGLQNNESQLHYEARMTIQRQVAQLTRLIDDLLEVSRLAAGKLHFKKERVALNRIVANAIETVRPLLNQHTHDLKVSLAQETIWLDADSARVEQVIVNLLTNAAKYTNEGGSISVTVEQKQNDGVLRVRDNGIGIAPELLPHVFGLFTQADQSLERSQGGLGIGLALVKQIVELHGGRVEVSSKLGQGSEFTLYFPIIVPPVPPSASAKQTVTELLGSPLRVLIVDDNKDVAQMLQMLLMESGHHVLSAHDGPSALGTASKYQPHVMLIDIGLPEMNGYEVAKKIRQQTIYDNVVLVALTGYGRESDRLLSEEAGFDHHLVKPIDFSTLEQILATISRRATLNVEGVRGI